MGKKERREGKIRFMYLVDMNYSFSEIVLLRAESEVWRKGERERERAIIDQSRGIMSLLLFLPPKIPDRSKREREREWVRANKS